jgi:hypothetical protein
LVETPTEHEESRRRWEKTLKCMFKKLDGTVWTGLIRQRPKTSGGDFVKTVMKHDKDRGPVGGVCENGNETRQRLRTSGGRGGGM